MKIVMVAGGSGGHIYPALSLADALKRRGHEISFIGSSDRMEKDVIPQHGYPFTSLKVEPSGSFIENIISVYTMFIGYFKAKKMLQGIDMVIGFGNYISVPVILAAKKLGIKTLIHEQNSFAGRANLFLDEKVDLVIASYEESLKQFKNPHIEVLGNPQASVAARTIPNYDLLEEYNLDPDKETVLIFFGSLGSQTLMEVCLELFKRHDGSYQILYACGSRYIDICKDYNNENIRVVERIDGIKAMRVCSVFVSRAGATSIAEICATGTPSILIPSPYVPNNHQYYNASCLVDKQAALMLQEKDLNVDTLKLMIEGLLRDDDERMKIRINALGLANANVIEDIIERVEKL